MFQIRTVRVKTYNNSEGFFKKVFYLEDQPCMNGCHSQINELCETKINDSKCRNFELLEAEQDV